jgi:hypothetical protein
VRFEFFTAVNIKVRDFWDVGLRNLVDRYHHFHPQDTLKME